MKLFPLLFIYTACFERIRSTVVAPRRRDFGQLPTTLEPVLYTIQLQPYFPAEGIQYDSKNNFTFDGFVRIKIRCLDATDKITLHMKNITLFNDTIRLTDSETHQLIQSQLGYEYDVKTDQVTFRLSQPLVPNKEYDLSVSYIGKLQTSGMAGIYPSSYVENGKTKWLVATQFQATDARRAFPCFDEPFYKAVFALIIIHPPNMKVLANTKASRHIVSIPNAGQWEVTMFMDTPKMSTYLLAFAICDFNFKPSFTRNRQTLFNVWARPSFIDSLDYSSEIGPKMLDAFAEFFDIRFPLVKQDMLAMPDFGAGAMENWGLVTYREQFLLHNERASSSEERFHVAVVVAHELAHQWFGNLVTMKWWSDLWLNEGFATYMEYVGADVVSAGKYKGDEMLVEEAVMGALKLDALTSSHPIFAPVATPDDIGAIFDAISYSKGASVIRMLQRILGETVFKDGLRKYMKKYKYGSAEHNDLWNSWNEAIRNSPNPLQDWSGGRFNVKEFMDPWILQMGFPLLSVTRTYGDTGRSAAVTQTKFTFSTNQPVDTKNKYLSPPFNFKWYVPVYYQTRNDQTTKFAWLKQSETLSLQASADNDWLLANWDVAAFCRVNYDERNWKLLTVQLLTDHEKIGVKNRAQLLSDSFELAKAGVISYRIPLDLSTYLLFEDALIPWKVAAENFDYFKLMLSASPSDYQNIATYINGLTVNQFTRLGWSKPGETLDDLHIRSLRALLIKYRLQHGVSDASAEATRMFTAYMNTCGGDNAISSSCSTISTDLRSPVYCAGVKANPSMWNKLWRLQAAEPVIFEKKRLLNALACTPDVNLQRRILAETVDIKSAMIKQQDVPFAFAFLSDNKDARKLLWPFFVDNWDFFKNNTGGFVLNNIVEVAAKGLNTAANLEAMKTFLNNAGGGLGSARQAYEQSMEKVGVNLHWMTERSGAVKEWFSNHPFKEGGADAADVRSKLLARINLD